MRWIATVVLAAGCGCNAEQVSFDTPIPVDDTFPREPATGAELARFEDAAAYSEDQAGRALMILRGDTVIFETGQNGHTLDEPHHLFSGTKTFGCALFAAAEADGLMRADDPVEDELPELADQGGLTVDHLLHLTSGVREDFFRLTLDGLRAEPKVADKQAVALTLPFDHAPGEVFDYGSAHFFLFSAFAGRRLDADPLDWLHGRVLDPIGLRTAGWIRDPAGTPAFAYGAWTTANEWAKLGVLLRDDGRFLGQEVLPPGALHGCFTGSDANPAYGRMVWLNRDVPDGVELVGEGRIEEDGPILWNDGPDDLVAAAGADDQRLYVVPGQDIVIVRLGNGSRSFRDRELLARILE